ncbi:sigma-70 family RNA polymerase sigma factor [Candidatus Woesearchaeota archaeon]|nr:sigma-70 family RNA polymerase sigma factor [Candidatus Woesearchaeota archaeon]
MQTGYRDELPDNVLSIDLYVIEKRFQLYSMLKDQQGKPYSKIRLSVSQLIGLFDTGIIPEKAGRGEIRLSLLEIAAGQVECYEANSRQNFPKDLLKKYGFRRKDLNNLMNSEPDIKIIIGNVREGETDPFKMYLDEISTHPLLTRRQEKRLIGLIRQGDLESERIMMWCNQKLVASSAIRTHKKTGYDRMDLVLAGNMGLRVALQKYDPSMAKFSTYAPYWIEQKMRREIANNRKGLHVPVHIQDSLPRYKKMLIHYLGVHGRPPTLEEVCQETGWKENKAANVLKATDFSFGGFLEDHHLKPSADEPIEDFMMKEKLEEIYDRLPKIRYKEIIKRRHGLFGCRQETLEEIGESFDVTRERVRQLEAEALDFYRTEMGVPTKVVNWVNGRRIPKRKKKNTEVAE